MDLAPVGGAFGEFLVMGAAAAFVEVGVVIAADGDDVAVSVARPGPDLEEGFEPIDGALDFGDGA